ncbi:peptidase M20 [Erwinia sp. OLTSP20]|uniref:M20 aminoacylase family protein n=1 Tax=unclassified Erwinia TaxID=2622719 RepID=UPI000C18F445|nr:MULTISPECIES: M20 aminoacylase family protein [unclassified Erwinia]PIJ48692.1 peptidase M20 [Erwinia sp. OAMSP11]PIJ69316.1 peptidase M20 [Erwinia sp. OLSSP12]PIJ79150.1 peptidase M20 [Erwinia sp. OLCASP19]PIJ80676.1 peptidase M20 [Erwinia sp. OLMTSP26]PIJ82826.1 peptidase M20 [Erwinia sp. OLMDSP33]
MMLPPALIKRAIAWRHQLHAYPELGYQEHHTAALVVSELRDCGLQVHTGLAGTGVIGTLENGPGPVIGLRADMDALPVSEQGENPWRSKNDGVMHACGHDGHTAMLLAAAHYLSQQRNFSGTVHMIFQPAEENLGGARKMVNDGLFSRFPMDAIYGMHNWPGLPLGHIAINPGAMMASLDTFIITLDGKSCHAAMPENGADPIVAAAQLITALQTIPSRRLSPLASAVISVTQIHGGEAINVIPDRVTLRGTLRCLQDEVRQQVKTLMASFVSSLTAPMNITSSLTFASDYPVTRNDAQAASQVRACAQALLPADQVHWDVNPSMASEDFACMLEQCPGAYFWIGADGDTPSAALHNARYDFNDAVLPHGIAFWIALVNHLCPPHQ